MCQHSKPALPPVLPARSPRAEIHLLSRPSGVEKGCPHCCVQQFQVSHSLLTGSNPTPFPFKPFWNDPFSSPNHYSHKQLQGSLAPPGGGGKPDEPPTQPDQQLLDGSHTIMEPEGHHCSQAAGFTCLTLTPRKTRCGGWDDCAEGWYLAIERPGEGGKKSNTLWASPGTGWALDIHLTLTLTLWGMQYKGPVTSELTEVKLTDLVQGHTANGWMNKIWATQKSIIFPPSYIAPWDSKESHLKPFVPFDSWLSNF